MNRVRVGPVVAVEDAMNRVPTNTRKVHPGKYRAKLAQVFYYIIIGLLHRSDLLSVLVGNLYLEFLFERHDKLNEVERIGVEVFDERGAGNNLTLINTQLVNNNLFESFGNSRHYFTSLSTIGLDVFCARLNIVPRTPLIKRLDLLLPNNLASSTASLMAAFAGTVLLNRIS